MNSTYTYIFYLNLYGDTISKVTFSVFNNVKVTLTDAIHSDCSDIVLESLKDEYYRSS